MDCASCDAKYNELDSVVQKYCKRKERETKTLRKQVEQEVSTNVELRKRIALLESKLLTERENVSRLEQLYKHTVERADSSAKEQETRLCKLDCDLSARLAMVEQRERECAERMAAVLQREGDFQARIARYESRIAELEAGLYSYSKTMVAELQLTQEVVDVAKDCLCDLRIKDNDLSEKEAILENGVLLSHSCARLASSEQVAREQIVSAEADSRSKLFTARLEWFPPSCKAIGMRSSRKEQQLQMAEDFMLLHNVELSSRLQTEKDLCQEARASLELRRREFATECRGVLRDVRELLDAIPDKEVENIRERLESKLQEMV